MTRQRVAVVIAAAALALTRSYWLPSRAPAWLRGASPFTWTATRAERERCLTFAEMIGSTRSAGYRYGENVNAKPEFAITRTGRSADSLVFDGQVHRNGRVIYVFHCATASVLGHPGEHRSEIAEPWLDAEEWPAVDTIEDRLRDECIDSLAVRHPTSVFSRKALMLRRVPGRGELTIMSVDTTLEDGSQILGCGVEPVPRGGQDYIWVHDASTER